MKGRFWGFMELRFRVRNMVLEDGERVGLLNGVLGVGDKGFGEGK